jgi:hypothetical protein
MSLGTEDFLGLGLLSSQVYGNTSQVYFHGMRGQPWGYVHPDEHGLYYITQSPKYARFFAGNSWNSYFQVCRLTRALNIFNARSASDARWLYEALVSFSRDHNKDLTEEELQKGLEFLKQHDWLGIWKPTNRKIIREALFEVLSGGNSEGRKFDGFFNYETVGSAKDQPAIGVWSTDALQVLGVIEYQPGMDFGLSGKVFLSTYPMLGGSELIY